MTLFPIKRTRFDRAGGWLTARARHKLVSAFLQKKAERGLKQTDIARDLGVDRAVINRALKGEHDMTFRQFGKIAESLDMTADIVLTSKENITVSVSNISFSTNNSGFSSTEQNQPFKIRHGMVP